MKCFNCGVELSEVSFCTNCKRDVSLYKKIVYRSNELYNDGLEKANVRDLSGAVKSLRQSLSLYKYNMDARNLLGLVYYEMGEIADASIQWVISSNFVDEGNMASEYIRMIQEDQTGFDELRKSIGDYNGALKLCQQGNLDLAKIRLKNCVTKNPRHIRAHQLLALIYIKLSQFDAAERELSKCLSIDKTNTISLRYMEYIQSTIDPDDTDRKSPFKNDDEPIRYVDGNEVIIQPSKVADPRSGSFGTVFNILIGLILGLAVMYFLVLPTKINQVRNEVKENIETLQANLDKKNADYDSLQRDLDEMNSTRVGLEEELGEYTGEAGTLADIDRILKIADMYIAGEDRQAIGDELFELSREVKTDDMSENAKKLYDQLYAGISAELAEGVTGDAYSAYYAGDFEKSSLLFEKAYFFNSDNTDAIYFAAVSYENAGDKEKAKELYSYVIDNFPDTYIASMSTQALNQLNGENG